MPYNNLREFLARLENTSELKHIDQPVSPYLEITEVCQRTLRHGGPALLFEHPAGYTTPLLGNLFGTLQRVMSAMNVTDTSGLRDIGRLLGFLREPQWPGSVGDAIEHLPYFQRLLYVTPRLLRHGACQEEIIEGKKVDLSSLPIQTCWPGDAGPLITWGLVITKGPRQKRCNIGIYRQQVIDRNKVIMRWLPHRGGAIDFQEWQHAYPGQRFPLNVVIGSDPAMLLAAATPIPDTLSEFQFAGLLRGSRTELIHSSQTGLPAPANAEYLLEGHIEPGETALEGPFGDHTGYYNSVDRFPVFTIERICHRSNPIYHSTYMGRSPYDEPSVLAMALNEMYIPVLQRTFPEIVDFYLPPAACSYRIAIISIRKQYAGHAQRIMFSVWSFLRQFTYTKLVIITDDDINVRDWQAVMWAVSTRTDPGRDVMIVENTPIDYLDFASPVAGLGGKLGIDATNKLHGETSRHWGRPIEMDDDVIKRIDNLWEDLWSIKPEQKKTTNHEL